MRSGGSVLEAPPGAEEGALPREHCPRAGHAALPRKHRPRAGYAEWCREHCPRAVSRTLPAQISFAACIGTEKGSPVFRRAFSVCARTSETKPDGVAGHAERGLRLQGAPAPQRGHSPASGSRLRGNNEAREREPVRRYRSTSPGSRAVPANATGDGA